jgi:hypothetical protein
MSTPHPRSRETRIHPCLSMLAGIRLSVNIALPTAVMTWRVRSYPAVCSHIAHTEGVMSKIS